MATPTIASQPERKSIIGAAWRRVATPDAAALAVLAVAALVVAGFLLRDDVFIYGDHAGHYWITWYTLTVAAPLHHRLIDWIPYWYAGYPELQFTPPGYVLLALGLDVVSLGRLSIALIYEIVTFAGYVLPGLTFFYAVRHLGMDRRAAFTAGLLALVFPSFFDGATSLFIGMIGSRLALALSALVLVWTIDWLEDRGGRYAWASAVTLAAGILAHPYYAIGITLALCVYVLVRRLPLVRSGSRLIAVVLASLALDAFWLAPLYTNTPAAMIPVIRSTLDQTWRILTDGSLAPYVLLVLPVLWRIRSESDSARRSVLIVLLVLPFLLASAMLVTHIVLIDRWHIYQVDPIRMIGEYYLALIWLAAIGLSTVADALASAARRARMPQPAVAWSVTLLVGALFYFPFQQSATYYQAKEVGTDEPRFLSQAILDYKLDVLWATLGATPGRVLFVSYATNLTAHKTEPFPTTLTALTPLYSGRAIMGGTYTAWSPIAADLWAGMPSPRVLWGLSQNQDDQSLFGAPFDKLSDAALAQYCRRFNITAIVASVDDYAARVFLDASPRFQSYYNNGFFFVYRIKDLAPSWIDATNADVKLIKFEDDRVELRVPDAQAGALLSVKLYAYPAWRAVTDRAERLPIQQDDLALMRIALPTGADYTVTLQYEPDLSDNIGSLVSLSTLFVFVGFGIRSAGRRIKSFSRGARVNSAARHRFDAALRLARGNFARRPGSGAARSGPTLDA